jgi:hypothetical protein
MKKLLGVLGAAGLVATSASTVVSCGSDADDYKLDLTSEDYDTLDEVRDYIMSQNGDIMDVTFFSNTDSAKVAYDALNGDNKNMDEINASEKDSEDFRATYTTKALSDLASFAYVGMGGDATSLSAFYGTITNSAK